MSTVAWDGKTLAVDSASNSGGIRTRGHKIVRLKSGEVAAWVGSTDVGLERLRWYRNGAVHGDFPDAGTTEDGCAFIVASPDGTVRVWERWAEPIPLRNAFMAWGSGRELAIAAMECGRSAADAVRVALKWDIHSGPPIVAMRVTPEVAP